MKRKIKVFLRQSFTESDEQQQVLIQKIIDKVAGYKSERSEVSIVNGNKAHNKDTFKQSFESNCGLAFTPANFRKMRLDLLSKSDLFIIVRTSMSESSAFEVAYNIFKAKNIPMLFLISESAPIKTTLIRELHDLSDATYFTFDKVDDNPLLDKTIEEFIAKKEK